MNAHRLSLYRPAWMFFIGAVLFQTAAARSGERINHEGRILGAMPGVTQPILFNTPEADAVVAALQIFPRDNAWNEDISRRPVHPDSDAMIGQIGSDLASNRRTLRAFQEMNFVLVPEAQPLVPIEFVEYPDESDPGPYPIPSNLPVETWPSQTGSLSLYDWQRDANGDGGDRHSIIIQPGSGSVWETWQTLLVVNNGQSRWQAANGAKFDMNSNALRPDRWTSADAAGLSMLGGLVRYDECERGMVEHAIRLIVKETRRAYIYPATHFASSSTNPSRPAMGQRLRLKSSFVIPENWTKQEKAILRGLKKYGAIVADNGNFFSISVVPDQRWPQNAFGHLNSISVTNFEVIQTTGPAEGPRSPGAPVVHAGTDLTAAAGTAAQLAGYVHFTNSLPLTVTWRQYAGPGQASFDDASKTNATVSFTMPGTYTLMLSADDGIHTAAYDAVVVTATEGLHVHAARNGAEIVFTWSGGKPPYALQHTASLPAAEWTTLLTTDQNSATIGADTERAFFRIQGSP